MNSRCYHVTDHARKRLVTRWPDTLLRPPDFDTIQVPVDAPVLGYDSASSALFLVVPDSPMVAVVVDGVVRTFLSRQAADAKIALHGYGPSDFRRHEEIER